jgi:BirA family biotin operon repressor/biotin-[acetyl-CoA-carboxylase] ligase
MSSKKNVLTLLENKRNQSISGEYIAEQLDVSRNTVWKAVRDLRKDGYKIGAVTNKGYCLCEDNDILSVEGMLPYVSRENISEKVFVYDRLESTNKTAKEMAVSGAEHGTVIIADCQTAGKGRYGRAFHSPPGHGLYMSLILQPMQYCFHTPTLITAFSAVSVCEAIEAISRKTPKIKWVNDIFLDGKKICGILTEGVTDFESGNIQWIVVGIGVNYSTPAMGFPEDLRHIAGSVFGTDAPPATRNRLAAEIVNRIVTQENQPDEKIMLEKYKQRMFMLGKNVLVTGAAGTYEATAVDIDNAGHLVVKNAAGEFVSLSAGEIRIRNK